MKIINTIIKWTLPLTFGITIICFSILLTLSYKGLYYRDINKLSIAEDSNIEEDIIKKDYNILIDYLTDTKIDKLSFSYFSMSKEGEIHFEDVKNIFITIRVMAYLTAVYTIIAAFIEIYHKRYIFLKYTAIGIIAIPLTIFSLVMINFDKAFIIFHKIAFTNDYWIFDPSKDPIITVLPQEFFYHSFLFIIVIILIISIVLSMIYKAFK